MSAHRRPVSEETAETAVTESTRMECQAAAEMQITNAEGVGACMTVDMEETLPRALGKTDSPSKRKG